MKMKRFVEVHQHENPRLKAFFVIFGLMFLTLIMGLAWRQLVKTEDYLAQEERQCLRRIIQPGPRGEIFDRDGRLLVGNRPLFTASVFLGELRYEFQKEYYKRVRNMRAAGLNVSRDKLRNEARQQVLDRYIRPINQILGKEAAIDTKALSQHFSQRLLLPMPVLKDLTPMDYARLTEQLPVESPIQVMVESARFYPYGSLASHVLGYVSTTMDVSSEGLPGNNLKTFSYKGKIGKRGIEKGFNGLLEGQSGGEIWLVDPVGFQYQLVDKKDSEKGKSLTTSIDIDIQMAAEKALEGHSGAVVAIDIETGEVIAMASAPDYNLNDLTPFIPQKTYDRINAEGGWLNRAIQGFYPPASPFKIITSVAGLKHGVMTPEETFECGSGFLVGNRMFPEHDHRSFGPVDLKKALQVSSNVYYYPIALKIGAEKLAEEAKNFGLHQKTGIQLPYEGGRMIVPNSDWKMNRIGESWRGGDTANMCIGQGFMRVTPLQMACFAAAFARKETRIQPTLIHDNNNTGKHPLSKPIDLSDSDYDGIIEGLKACADVGAGKYAKVPGMTLAAKTGTGQARLHSKEVSVPWFLGFGPIEDPKIALVVLIEGKDKSVWGGTTAGPVANLVLSTYYQKYLKGS